MQLKKEYMILILLVLALAVGAWYFSQSSPLPPTPITDKVVLHTGERSGSLLVQRIFPDRIEGLNFPEYPVAFEEGLPITLYIGETASNGCTIFLKLERINGNSAEFMRTLRDPNTAICPICLSGETQIATPNGNVNVKELQPGMRIWTTNKNGNKIESIILRVNKTKVPSAHKVVHLILSDGRSLLASPGHTLSDGRLLGEIKVGDEMDHAVVVKAALIPYTESYTYDVLPAGKTGTYWANGILMKSTLFDSDN